MQEIPSKTIARTESRKAECVKNILRRLENRLELFSEEKPDSLEKKFHRIFRLSESLIPKDNAILLQEAALYYKLARSTQKPRFLLLARKKLEEVVGEELNPAFLHLSGNILVGLSRFSEEETLLEKGIDQLQAAEKLLRGDEVEKKGEILWDLARAWIRLGEKSQEVADFSQAFDKYSEATKFNTHPPTFWIDYAEGLYQMGLLTRKTLYFQSSIEYLKKAIADLYTQENSKAEADLVKAWKVYLQVMKKKLELEEITCDEIDPLFFEAICAIPKEADLWMQWGALYLNEGWLKKELSLIEKGLEKITSSKIALFDPLRFSALFGQGLITMGLFLEDFRLINEGEKRVLQTLQVQPTHPQLLYSAGLGALAKGLYFSETTFFYDALLHFKKGLASESGNLNLLHGVFEAYLGLGVMEKEVKILKKALKAIHQLCELSPTTSLYYYEEGITLASLADIEESETLLEKAIEQFRLANSLQEEQKRGIYPKYLFQLACALDDLGEMTGEPSHHEEAIAIFSELKEKSKNSTTITFRLALALSHLGETEGDSECLLRASEIFEKMAVKVEENDTFYCAWGYTLLNLAELVYDTLLPEKAAQLRAAAEEKLILALKLGSVEANYHLACLYSLSGYYDSSLTYLQRAEETDSLPDLENLEQDEWLEGVRQTIGYQELACKLKEDE